MDYSITDHFSLKRCYIFIETLVLFLFLLVDHAHAGKMIFTDRGSSIVMIADLDGSNLETLIPSAGTNIRGIAIDLATDDLFYADNGANTIYRSRLDGSDRGEIVSTDLNFPADLALDRDAGKLYWCDRDKNRIERTNYDGTERESLITTLQPYFLDLDLMNKKIYWGDYAGGNIFRANLPDGTNEETVVTGLVQTRGIKIDPKGGYFYWCDRNASKVQRRSIDDGPITDLYTGLDTPHGMTLDIPAGKVYWADTGTNQRDGTGKMAVNRGDMDGLGPQEVLANANEPWDITLDVRTSTYSEWVARRFQKDAPPSAVGPNADPDLDLHNNLVEYFGAMDPLSIQNLQPTSIFWDEENILFTHRKKLEAITDVQATIEISTNLQIWNSGPDFIQVLDTNSDNGALNLVHKLLPDKIASNGTYVRLRLELVNQ